jgi:hypothetical protein
MAEYGDIKAIEATANADLSAHQYRFVRIAGANTVDVASNAAAAGQAAILGVLQTKPDSGRAASVGISGESKVSAGAAFTAGDWLTCNGCGQAIAADSGDVIAGRALVTAGAANDIVRAFIFPAVRLSGAA